MFTPFVHCLVGRLYLALAVVYRARKDRVHG